MKNGVLLFRSSLLFFISKNHIFADQMTSKKLNILFLPAWYPHRDDAMLGLFVKNHALSILPYANVSVIYVLASDTNVSVYEVEKNDTDGIYEIIIYFKKCNTPIFGFFINIIRMLLSYKKGWNIVLEKRNKPDINHVHILTRAGVIALILKQLYKIPYVITEHWSRYYSFNDSYNGILRKFMTKKVVKQASAMSTVSDSLKNAMNQNGLINKNWEIIPNSIDTDIFTPSIRDKKDSKTRIFHISCFEDKSKNVSGIIRAFATASTENPNLELIMIGTGQDHQKAIDLSNKLKLDNKIEFTGELSPKEVSQKINSCDFQVLFSNYETFAIVIAESLAAGKAVIATNTGAIPEVLPKEFGLLIDAKDEDMLSKSILEMAKTHQKYDIEAMRNYAVSNYNKDKVGKQIIAFYKKYTS